VIHRDKTTKAVWSLLAGQDNAVKAPTEIRIKASIIKYLNILFSLTPLFPANKALRRS